MSITTYSEFEGNFLVRNGMPSNDINLNKAPRQLKVEIDELNLNKQQALVSGTNIKTINGATVLGSGDIAFPTYLPPTNLGADKFLSGDGTYKIIDTVISWSDVTNKPVNTVLNESFTATAGQTSYSITYNPNSLSVFKNGSKLKENIQFIAIDGTSITFNPALSAGDYIDITGLADTSTLIVYNKTEVDTLVGDLTLLLDAINGETI